MIIHTDFEQRSAEWYAIRLGKVTASNAHRLLTPAKFKSYFIELLAETVTKTYTEGFVSEAMQWGIEQEPFAVSWYMEKNAIDASECAFVELEGMNAGCSPDLLVGELGMAQIKCPTPKTHALYMMEGPGNEIYVQMQFEMFCYQAEWNDFVSFDPRWPNHLKGYVLRVARDNTMIERLEQKTKEMKNMIDEFLTDKRITLKEKTICADPNYPLNMARYLGV